MTLLREERGCGAEPLSLEYPREPTAESAFLASLWGQGCSHEGSEVGDSHRSAQSNARQPHSISRPGMGVSHRITVYVILVWTDNQKMTQHSPWSTSLPLYVGRWWENKTQISTTAPSPSPEHTAVSLKTIGAEDLRSSAQENFAASNLMRNYFNTKVNNIWEMQYVISYRFFCSWLFILAAGKPVFVL